MIFLYLCSLLVLSIWSAEPVQRTLTIMGGPSGFMGVVVVNVMDMLQVSPKD